MAEETKQRKVNIKTDGLTKEDILTVIHSHVLACQKATAILWAMGDSRETTDESQPLYELRDALTEAEKASRV
jgi:hypothetical protein